MNLNKLTTPPRVQKLQTALHDKAKELPNFRFYALDDKVYRKDVLAFAHACCQAQRRSSGSRRPNLRGYRGVRSRGWLDERAQELKSGTYRPLPVRRVYRPKPDEKQRPLGVPAIRDRTVEMAAVLAARTRLQHELRDRGLKARRVFV